MEVSFAKPGIPKTGALVTTVTQGKKLTGTAAAWDRRSRGQISRAAKAKNFTGEDGEILEVIAPAGFSLNRVVLIGTGKEGKISSKKATQIGGRLASFLNSAEERTAQFAINLTEQAEIDATRFGTCVAEGAKLRCYRFDQYKTKKAKKPKLNRLTIQSENLAEARASWKSASAVVDGVFFARDLVTEPGNVLYPAAFVERIKALKELGLKIEVLNEKKMEELGMGALLGVGRGSQHESYLVIMEWQGASNKKEAPVAFVGKGVTFDTGGISLKPGPGMEEMKFDMGGAAAVCGVMQALAGRDAKVNAVGIVGLVENMPDGTAQRPGDVVTSMSGQTIEVLNTDAEGRLVLADALWYCQDRFKPKFMIDLATLTGAIIVSLGSHIAGLFSNDDELVDQLESSGRSVDEQVWRFPMDSTYDGAISSPIADMANIANERGAGSITAAQFLKRFVNRKTWAHLDIAGTAWTRKNRDVCPRGATGFGVRLLNDLVAKRYEEN